MVKSLWFGDWFKGVAGMNKTMLDKQITKFWASTNYRNSTSYNVHCSANNDQSCQANHCNRLKASHSHIINLKHRIIALSLTATNQLRTDQQVEIQESVHLLDRGLTVMTLECTTVTELEARVLDEWKTKLRARRRWREWWPTEIAGVWGGFSDSVGKEQ
ncbi:uncharacterized protein G2W53_037665 [Senna tora]|uniref:Uncharacterized protein n=1 Tax=Senna tora TaxID=362788 RepID=A0A834W643_9FABA|nr:uncharacterized protein G2W53_037665 [Senna tora]